MKTHTTAGAAAFQKVVEQSRADVFSMAQRICLHHHERWDGTGYPARLAGEAIPLEARVMAMADVYDAMLSRRVYKAPLSYEATEDVFRECAGTSFDPEMTEVMLDNIGRFREIHARFRDS